MFHPSIRVYLYSTESHIALVFEHSWRAEQNLSQKAPQAHIHPDSQGGHLIFIALHGVRT
ncbi:hypothetical protein JZ751_009990 [Albula glossodonta]|uniref:Uncharacterized protein n=1 Tax=Albula glossodonta TaxID=121402 RepID=A0A8T2N325_9TELE|nr:hypothetical protein JZ751_009990 [Albula glossodonta]